MAELKIHPVADLFPMLPDDELNALGADIKTRGLLHPIVLDDEKRIIDGRNRFAACQMVEVEPQFTVYEGDDPAGYALMVNIRRRNISKGQQAMVVARAMRLDGAKKISIRAAEKSYGITNAYFSQANTVLDHAPAEVDRVMAGYKPLSDAYEIAKTNKKAKDEEADELAALRAEAPDLADEVAEERLAFSDAIAQLEERREETKLIGEVTELDKLIIEDGSTPFGPRAESGAMSWDEAKTLAERWHVEYKEAINRDVYRIQGVNDGWGSALRLLVEPSSPRSKAAYEKLTNIDVQRLNEMRDQIIARIGDIRKGARNA